MKKQFYLNLVITITATALVVAGIVLPTGKLNGFCLGLGGSIAALFTGFHIGRYVFSAPFHEEKASKADSLRPDVGATRQWVEQKLNASTANCIRVGGESHKDIIDQLADHRIQAPAYYLLVGKAKSGRMIGRLFSGRNLGIAISKPCAWEKQIPSPLTEDEGKEYAEWQSKADWEYTCNCNHTSNEEWAQSGGVHIDIHAHEVPAIQCMLIGIGSFHFS